MEILLGAVIIILAMALPMSFVVIVMILAGIGTMTPAAPICGPIAGGAFLIFVAKRFFTG